MRLCVPVQRLYRGFPCTALQVFAESTVSMSGTGLFAGKYPTPCYISFLAPMFPLSYATSTSADSTHTLVRETVLE
ncbi:hypothetical protein L596_013702 [Steinernema carpocapsae]|uniref:Uncharacterized protein n=1 Tax=Steinernema carpocapsae TaxID=34508 RepID=A0A4U5P1M6_STECR|nr:hypothetical protein L596_013702 [Steinernema carpocapsae]